MIDDDNFDPLPGESGCPLIEGVAALSDDDLIGSSSTGRTMGDVPEHHQALRPSPRASLGAGRPDATLNRPTDETTRQETMTGPDSGLPAVSERRQYRHPPIEEALCEVRFVADEEWDPTLPGLVYQSLRAEYPAKPTSQGLLQAGINVRGEDGDGPTIMVRQDLNRVQFKDDSGKRIAAVGPAVLSVHLLRPYTEWENFREQIKRALDAYIEVTKPEGVVRIGVRYVNKIEVGAPSIDLDEYFVSAPSPPDPLPQTIKSFVTRVETCYDEEPVRIVTTFATSTDVPAGSTGFLLDIDVVLERQEDPLAVDDVMQAIDDLRSRERIAFEALITDRTREIFDAD